MSMAIRSQPAYLPLMTSNPIAAEGLPSFNGHKEVQLLKGLIVDEAHNDSEGAQR